MDYTIALAGNPNSGKTTLFNALTGSNQYVGNWPGVTVEKKEARFEIEGETATLTDLPGVYSLYPYSIEEKIARGHLIDGAPDVILNVVDATNAGRNLYLTLQLLALRRPTVIALNFIDALGKAGEKINCRKLGELLGAPVVPISARSRKGFDALFTAIHLQARTGAENRAKITRADRNEETLDDRAFLDRAQARYARIDAILAACDFPAAQDTRRASDRIDRVVTHRAFGFPIFAGLLLVIFALVFGPVGETLCGAAAALIDFIGGALQAALRACDAPMVIQSLAIDGVVAGVGGVAAFLPQILLLFLCLAILEDGGYLARAAFLTDRPLSKLGLSGRSFIPLLIGYGCTTTAIIAARGVENERDRRMTMLLTPFMSCGAKLPVYALFTAALFPDHRVLVVAGLYALGAAALAGTGAVLRKTAFRKGETPFLMELPEYRRPTARNVLNRLKERAVDFIKRAGTVIFAMSVLNWFFCSFTPDFRWAADAGRSILARLGMLIAPAFRPLGFGQWESVVSLLSGTIAKEAVVSSFQVLYGAEHLMDALRAQFTPASALAYLVFVLLSAPCLAALAALRRESGSRRFTLGAIALQTGAAYLIALIVYRIALWAL